MTDRFRIALAQLNPVMGDIAGNLARARDARAQAPDADVILFSELFIIGYPPEDLVLKAGAAGRRPRRDRRAGADTADGGPAILIGAPWVEDGKLYNAMLLLDGGRIAGRTFKHRSAQLRRVRREARLRAGPAAGAVRRCAACSSACRSARTSGRRMSPPAWPRPGAEILCVPNGSPFEAGKEDVRLKLARSAGHAKPACR